MHIHFACAHLKISMVMLTVATRFTAWISRTLCKDDEDYEFTLDEALARDGFKLLSRYVFCNLIPT